MEVKKMSNDELLTQISISAENHEKVKQEILIMVELLNIIQSDYLECAEELEKRKG